MVEGNSFSLFVCPHPRGVTPAKMGTPSQGRYLPAKVGTPMAKVGTPMAKVGTPMAKVGTPFWPR